MMMKKKNRQVKQKVVAAANDGISMGDSTMEGDGMDLIVDEIQNPKVTKFSKKKEKTDDHMPLLPGVSPQQVVKHKVSNGNINGVQSLSPILPVTECRET